MTQQTKNLINLFSITLTVTCYTAMYRLLKSYLLTLEIRSNAQAHHVAMAMEKTLKEVEAGVVPETNPYAVLDLFARNYNQIAGVNQ